MLIRGDLQETDMMSIAITSCGPWRSNSVPPDLEGPNLTFNRHSTSLGGPSTASDFSYIIGCAGDIFNRIFSQIATKLERTMAASAADVRSILLYLHFGR